MTRTFLICTLCILLAACIPETPCQLTALEPVTAYSRPSAAANVFGTLGLGEIVQVDAKTADGFYGFDPGVAQAGNVGVFRNRWILKTYQVALSGDCTAVPTVVGPIANLCYAMSMGDTPVYASADTASEVIMTFHTGDYAHALETSSGWVKVDLNVGSASIDSLGWILESGIGYNGECGGL